MTGLTLFSLFAHVLSILLVEKNVLGVECQVKAKPYGIFPMSSMSVPHANFENSGDFYFEIRNDDSSDCGTGMFTVDITMPSGWGHTLEPSSPMAIDPGDTQVVKLYPYPPQSATKGSHWIYTEIINTTTANSSKKYTFEYKVTDDPTTATATPTKTPTPTSKSSSSSSKTPTPTTTPTPTQKSGSTNQATSATPTPTSKTVPLETLTPSLTLAPKKIFTGAPEIVEDKLIQIETKPQTTQIEYLISQSPPVVQQVWSRVVSAWKNIFSRK